MKSLREPRTSKGRAIQNLIKIDPDDKVMAFINVQNLTDQEYINNNYIVLCTSKGIIKENITGGIFPPTAEWYHCHQCKRRRQSS